MSDEQVQRPTTDDRNAWKEYWAKVQPREWFERWGYWRTEPEIDEDRQEFLAERRAVRPDIERGIYPFRDENGSIKLTRADIEWLVATHDAGAPVASSDGLVLMAVIEAGGSSWTRNGPDLRGADLQGVDLSYLPLEDARFDGATLAAARLDGANLEGAHLAGAECTGATMCKADLESADLRNARLQNVDLSGAHLFQASLKYADLRGANLRGADLAWVYMVNANLADADLTGVRLADAIVAGGRLDGIRLDTHTAANLLGVIVARVLIPQTTLPLMDWTTLPFASIDWTVLFHAAEEGIHYWQDVIAGRAHTYVSPSTSPEAELVKWHRLVARSYQRVATVWQEQGLDEYADQLRRRADTLRQEVVRRGEDPDHVDPIDDADSEGEVDLPF